MKASSPVIPGMHLEETVFAKNQPQYTPLPAVVVVDHGARVISRWKLTWRERLKILFTGNLWLSMLTFGQPLQPVVLEVDSPRRYLRMQQEGPSEESLSDA